MNSDICTYFIGKKAMDGSAWDGKCGKIGDNDRRKLKHYRRAYASGKIELSAISRSLASYRGHLSHGHTYKLWKNLMDYFILQRKETEQ